MTKYHIIAFLLFIQFIVIESSSSSSCVCYHGNCDENNNCICDSNYEGIDCSIYNKVVAAGDVIEDSISTYNWKYYHLQTTNSQTIMTITVEQLSSGDIDVYLSNSAYPSDQNNFNYDDTTSNLVTLTVNPLIPNLYYIGLYAYQSCSFRLTIDITDGCLNGCNGNGDCDSSTLTCSCYSPYTGDDCSLYDLAIVLGQSYYGYVNAHSWVFYHFTSTIDSGIFTAKLNSFQPTNGEYRSAQFFMRKEERPTFALFDYANTTVSAEIDIKISSFNTGLWEIGIYGYSGGAYSLFVDVVAPPTPTCMNDCTYRGDCNELSECECGGYFSGDYCETYNQNVLLNTIYQGYAAESYWNYWSVRYLTSQSIQIQVTENLGGICNVYIRPDEMPNRVQNQYSTTASHNSTYVVIQYPGDQVWYVGIYGYSNCAYSVKFSFINRCMCGEDGHGHCETDSTYCVCDLGWAGSSCTIEANEIRSLEVIHSSVMKNQMKYFYVQSNSSALIITMEEKNTKGFAWLLIDSSGYPTLEDHEILNYGASGEPRYHEVRYLWSSKRERIYYISVLGSSIDISPDPVEFAITAYYTPF